MEARQHKTPPRRRWFGGSGRIAGEPDRAPITSPSPPLTGYRSVVVLTGAGVSAASGLPTFRGPTAMVGEVPLEQLHHVDSLPGSAEALWRTWGPLRTRLREVDPNAAHHAVERFAATVRHAGGTCHVVTQNIDGLHQRAGTRDVTELHGSVSRTRCSDRGCSQQPWADEVAHTEPPSCPTCGSVCIPDIVLFGEPVDLDAQWATKRALRACDLFIAAGTSAVVSPAAGFFRYARDVGARSILVNLTPSDPPHPLVDEEHVGPAETLLPRLLGGAEAAGATG